MRIFVAPGTLRAGELAIRGDEHHYLTRVRRVRVGEALDLVDGEGLCAPAEIVRIDAQATTVAAREPVRVAPQPPWVRALVPLIKGDRMDVCLEKLVEVGVDEVIVWPAARAVVRLEGERLDGRIAKYQELMRAASRQSRRPRLPVVSAAVDLAAAMPRDGVRWVLDPASDQPVMLALAAAMPKAAPSGLAGGLADITVITGPEGGFAPAELDQLAAAGFVGIGLGPRVLRAETAPVVAVAVIRALTRS